MATKKAMPGKKTKAPFKTGAAVNGTQSKKVKGAAPAPKQR